MRRDTKLAIIVAVVCIGLGTWYVFRDKFSSGKAKSEAPSTAAKQPAPDKTAPPTVARNVGNARPGAPLHRPVTTRRSNSEAPSPLAQAGPHRPGPAVTESVRPLPTVSPGTTPPAPQSRIGSPGFAPSGLGTTSQPAGLTARASEGPRPGLAPPALGESAAKTSIAARSPSGTGQVGLAGASTPGESSKPGETKTHVVQAGDNFSTLAEKYLGNMKYASLIAKANPNVDPRKLKVGSKINVPPAPEAAATASPTPPAGPARPSATPTLAKAEPIPAGRAYTVKDGERWYNLASRFLGKGERWTELYELNKERVPRNPNILPPGTVIELPKDANMNAAAAPTTKPAAAEKSKKAT